MQKNTFPCKPITFYLLQPWLSPAFLDHSTTIVVVTIDYVMLNDFSKELESVHICTDTSKCAMSTSYLVNMIEQLQGLK